MQDGQRISPHSDRVLRAAMATFLQRAGLPLPLARLSALLTRTIHWEHSYTLPTGATTTRGALESWLAHDDDCRLIASSAQNHPFLIEIEGIIIVKRSVTGPFSPKVVATTIQIAPQSPQESALTIHNRVKVGYLSSRSLRISALTACATAADMAVATISRSHKQ